MAQELEKATFGAGCFWCVEPIFREMRGVKDVVVGYAGGTKPRPTYEEVSSGSTGHAEVAQLTFEPSEVSYEKLLAVFWNTHDPTQVNRQGADVGPQYRSIILYANEAQKAAAEKSKTELASSGKYAAPIATEIVPLTDFFEAEEYHQRYYEEHPEKAYCQVVIVPKLEKFKKKFGEESK
jgi:peptide-methionine (S)-S-oxide reductase